MFYLIKKKICLDISCSYIIHTRDYKINLDSKKLTINNEVSIKKYYSYNNF